MYCCVVVLYELLFWFIVVLFAVGCYVIMLYSCEVSCVLLCRGLCDEGCLLYCVL